MVRQHAPLGLVAATRSDVTPPLAAVAASCGWPLVLKASPRRLVHELSLLDPECLLFWLDDWAELAATARLVEWSQRRGARPYRVTVAYRLEANVEAVLRAAGAHSFVSIADRPGSAFADALRPVLAAAVRPIAATPNEPHTWMARPGPVETATLPAELVRPP